jgi:acetylornithine deacetylase/succinyl-diaminopimelate desuccinylase-like protein
VALFCLGAPGPRAAEEPVRALLKDPSVRAALEALRRDEPRVIEDQVALTQIPAPGFHEAARAAAMKRRFEEAGLLNVRIDKAGNVIGERPGSVPRPNIVLAAHLDTVFPAGTNVTVKREGRRLSAPGIADDGRGLAVLVGVARALGQARVQTRGSITFVADVGEEGVGNLRGMRQLLGDTLKEKVDAFVSIDGSGLGITTTAVGSRRYRVVFKGPGGHSFGAFGTVNPIHALGRAVARIAEFQVPEAPRVTFSVGRIGGGTSVNSIAQEAWFEIDLRSSDASALASLDARVKRAVEEAVRDENARWPEGRITATLESLGDRPAGRTPDAAPIVQTALAASAALGLPETTGEGSTDANLPMSFGIPAIAIGGGGQSTGGHSLAETFEINDASKGASRALLVVVALAR